jgi:hypothetical protein
MQPGRPDAVDLQGFAGKGAQALVEIGGKQRIAPVPSPVIMECGACEPWLEQGSHPPLCHPLAHLVERMIAVQDGQDQGFDPTPTREPMGGMGWEKTVDHRSNLQTPEDSKYQGEMRHGINLLHGNGHDAPPDVAYCHSIIAKCRCLHERLSPPEQKSCGST